MELILFLILCALVGILVGFLGGLLGIGGGIIITPVLISLYSQWPGLTQTTSLAVGTSLGAIIFISLSSSRAQIKKGAVNWQIVRLWVLPLMVGSFSAGHLAGLLPEYWLLTFIACFLFLVAIFMFTRWQPTPGRQLPGHLLTAAIAAPTGLISGLIGIGGANIVIPTLVYFNLAFPKAAAISSTLGVPIALAGTMGFIGAGWNESGLPVGSLGYVHLPAVAAIATTSVLAAPFGVNLAHRTPAALLKRIFAVMLLFASARLTWLAYIKWDFT